MKKQTIVIFEGADQSGKSTIAKALSEQLSIPVFKIERTNTWWDPYINLRYATEAVTQFIEQTNSSVILDRWMGSDFMYDKLFNRHSDRKKIFDIDKRLAKRRALLVICYKQPKYYTDDKKDGELFDTSAYTTMTKIYKKYATLTSCKVLLLDTSDQNLKEQLNKIQKKL